MPTRHRLDLLMIGMLAWLAPAVARGDEDENWQRLRSMPREQRLILSENLKRFDALDARQKATVRELDEQLSRPTEADADAMATLDGDLLILGVGGKMGPSLARLARRAADLRGTRLRIIAVARFSNPTLPAELAAHGVARLPEGLRVPARQVQAVRGRGGPAPEPQPPEGGGPGSGRRRQGDPASGPG